MLASLDIRINRLPSSRGMLILAISMAQDLFSVWQPWAAFLKSGKAGIPVYCRQNEGNIHYDIAVVTASRVQVVNIRGKDGNANKTMTK